MRDTPFETNAELDDYFSDSRIQCLECGKRFANLTLHLASHHMTAADYREKWAIPAGRGLVGSATRDKLQSSTSRRWVNGDLTGEHLADAAKHIDYGNRANRVTASDRHHRERLEKAKPWTKNQLPAGSTAAGGRDAVRRREYQRAYRAQRDGDDSLMIAYRAKYQQ